jgi:membrane protein insertase Oxa1/YidC/SpoIIIJ
MKYTIVSSDAEIDENIEKKNYILSNMISSFFFSSLAFGLLIYHGLNVNWIFSEGIGIVIGILIFGIATLLFGLRDIFKLRKTIKKINSIKQS